MQSQGMYLPHQLTQRGIDALMAFDRIQTVEQRADHHGQATPGTMPGDGRNLVTQALAAAGRHQHQRVTADNQMRDDLRLRAAESTVAEDVMQDGRREIGSGRSHENSVARQRGRW